MHKIVRPLCVGGFLFFFVSSSFFGSVVFMIKIGNLFIKKNYQVILKEALYTYLKGLNREKDPWQSWEPQSTSARLKPKIFHFSSHMRTGW